MENNLTFKAISDTCTYKISSVLWSNKKTWKINQVPDLKYIFLCFAKKKYMILTVEIEQ